MNKNGRFAPFYVILGILGILLIGSFITPFKIVLDDIFGNIEESATANGNPALSCTDPSASGIMKATCFTLGGFMVVFILYTLYYWISGMVAGAKSPTPVYSSKLNMYKAALEG